MANAKFPTLSIAEQTLVRSAMANSAYSTQELLANKLGISTPRLNRILRGTEGGSPEIRGHLENLLPVQRYSLVRLKNSNPDAVVRKDLKVILRDDGSALRRSLESVAEIPNFRAVVSVSEMEYFKSLDQKKAFSRHYFQPSAIFTIKWPGSKPHWLAAKRKPKGIKYLQTTGHSILFGASYELESHMPGYMEAWLQIAKEQPAECESAFCGGEGCVLEKLLGYKLNLPQQSFIFDPFGVITRKAPEAPENLYTQYVFHASFQFSGRPRSDELADISNDGTELFIFSQQEDPERVCCNETGKPLEMDVLAWKSFLSETPRDGYGTAKFARGFKLI